jgi:cytochrome c oxidase subunit 4
MTTNGRRRTIWIVWCTLMSLLAVSAASTRLDLGWGNVAVNLGAATIKAGLIAFFFMRLRDSAGAVRITLLTTVLMLSLLIGLSSADVFTRNGPARGPPPPGPAAAR